MNWLRAAIVALLVGAGADAGAVQPDEVLDDPALEARARAISAEVRCVVCQNETVDTSNAGVARDLRLLIRERLVAGDTDEEVLQYLVDRYGDFVLFRPPLRADTAILWFSPFVLLFGAAIGAFVFLRRKPASPRSAVTPLNVDEEAALAMLESELDAEAKR